MEFIADGPVPRSTAHPLVIGHRGASGYRPEHTEAAYRLAVRQGADAVEPDVVATKDGVLVVRHENEISTTTDVAEHRRFQDRATTKRIDGKLVCGWFTEDFTWEELAGLEARERLRFIRRENRQYETGESILRLRDVLRIVDDEAHKLKRAPVKIVLEIKHAHYFRGIGLPLEQLVLNELHENGFDSPSRRIIFESFELGALERVRSSGFDAPRIFLLESSGSPADGLPHSYREARPYSWYRTDEGLDWLSGRVDGISVAKRDLFQRSTARAVTTDLVDRAHDRGLNALTWTLRPENVFLHPQYRTSLNPASWGNWCAEFSQIISTGVDGLFVDHIDLGVQARDEPA